MLDTDHRVLISSLQCSLWVSVWTYLPHAACTGLSPHVACSMQAKQALCMPCGVLHAIHWDRSGMYRTHSMQSWGWDWCMLHVMCGASLVHILNAVVLPVPDVWGWFWHVCCMEYIGPRPVYAVYGMGPAHTV